MREKNKVSASNIRNVLHLFFLTGFLVLLLSKRYWAVIPYLIWLVVDYVVFRIEKEKIRVAAEHFGFITSIEENKERETNIYDSGRNLQELVPTDHFYWWKYGILNNLIDSGKKILDVGCGNGAGTALLKKSECEICGCDYMDYSREFKKNTSGEFIMADAEKLPYGNDTFDYVICNEAIEHFPNAPEIVKEMARVAKERVFLIQPNGLLTFGIGAQATLNPINLIESILIHKGVINPLRARFERHHGIYIHHYYRNLKELRSLMENSGLRPVYHKAFFNLVSRILYRVTGRKELCEKIDSVCFNFPILNCLGNYLLVIGEKI